MHRRLTLLLVLLSASLAWAQIPAVNSNTAVPVAQGGTNQATQRAATPTVSACGTNPSVTGNDSYGTITVGSGVSTTNCTLTFGSTHASAPACVVSASSSGVVLGLSTSTTALTLGMSLSLSAGRIFYICGN